MFIPVLEHYNLVHMIDLFVLDEVFRYQKEQIREGHRTVPISVNFSKMTIMYPELIEKVTQMVQKYDIPVELIHIEVTETVGDMDHVLIENVANSLKELGFRLSMDDFGSHYSNLAVLIQYDFDSAKIDRSMVTEITNNRKSRILLDYMTSMINDLGIHCIVEGIELIGSIRDEILNTDELAVELIRFLKTQYPGILTERYEVEETQKETELLCGIAENRKCITKGGELDYSKAAALLIDEFRSGKLGKVTLEWPKEQENG